MYSTERLIAIQKKLAKKVTLVDAFKKVESVAGCDVAYAGEDAYCAVVVLDSALNLIERKVTKTKVSFPYIPTFLAFREAAPILKTLKKVKHDFDVLLVDGQGIAHPRGVGIASHIGVLLDVPTIGVAKRRLCGSVRGKVKLNKPCPLLFEGRQVGYAIQTKKNTNAIYISPGHKVSLKSSLQIVRRCIKSHKLPEPLRIAHELAGAYRR